jgi:glucosamine--fructose-6-phosphate aminotransferase (isomerizing)
MTRPTSSAMASEIAQIPELAAQLLSQDASIVEAAAHIRAFQPRVVVVCGRGSSGHVGTHLRYLVETRLGLITSESAPSVFTVYDARQDMHGVLFVVISQSGQSPDLLRSAQVARECGALTLALVNDAKSPVAHACELVVDISAGAERAVAATKTVVLSAIAGGLLIAKLADDDPLSAELRRLPERLHAALSCDWSSWTMAVVDACASFVAGRGFALGPVREVALKITEVLGAPSLGFSSAELRHGPRAAIKSDTPVLVLRQEDGTAETNDDLVRDLRAAGNCVFMAGGPNGTLPWIGNEHPALDPIAMLLPAYVAIEAVARAKGLDPDQPPFLSKVTQTF